MKNIRLWLGLGLGTFIKIISGLVIIKCMSYTLGPDAFGQLSQLITVVAIVSMFSGGGISNGLIQRLSSSTNSDIKIKYTSAAISIYVASSCVVSFILWGLCYTGLLFQFIGQQQMRVPVYALAFSQWFIGGYNIAQAIFSSKQQLRLLIVVNILGPLIGTIVFIGLLWNYNLSGAAVGVVFLPAFSGLIALFFLVRYGGLDWKTLKFGLRNKEVKTLLTYSGVMLVASISLPLSQILIRNFMAEIEGWTAVGYWFGVIKISDVYMQFIGILLMNYALPIFSLAADLHSLELEIRKILLPLMIVSVPVLFCFYLFKSYIISLFFSNQFLQMEGLFLPQFIGDYLRIIFSSIACVFLARGYRVFPVFHELFQGIGLFFFSSVLIHKYGLMAPIYAHILVYFILLLFISIMYFLLRHTWFEKENHEYITIMH